MSEREGPWRRHQRKLVYDNPWISVHHDEVTTPGGQEGIYGVVGFKHHAVAVVPVDEHGDTWLVRQHRYPLGQRSLEVPEGGCPPHESPEACARRELEEEGGLKASDLILLQRVHLSNSVTDEAGSVFVARGLSPGVQALESSEGDLEVVKMSLRAAVDLVASGDITDALSVIGLLLAERFLQKEGT